MVKPSTPLAFALSLTLSLVACGGGGGGGSETAVPAASPTVVSNVTVAIPASTYATGSAELGGWTVLQQARVLCGFGALAQNTKLDAAELNHARYLTNVSVTSGTSLLSHYESVTSNPYYSGYSPWARTLAQGYGSQVAEILGATVWTYDISNPPILPSLQTRGEDSMRNLLNTVYHLMGAMYDGSEVGFGADIQTVASGSTRREEYRFGSLNGFQNTALNIKLGTGVLATYPCQGSTDIPSAFVPANETPNPFPAMTSSTQQVGPPIYLKVDASQVLTLTAASVSQNGVAVATTVLTKQNDPQLELGQHEVFVVPNAALLPNTPTAVRLSGQIDGTPFTRNFTMTTGL